MRARPPVSPASCIASVFKPLYPLACNAMTHAITATLPILCCDRDNDVLCKRETADAADAVMWRQARMTGFTPVSVNSQKLNYSAAS